MFIFQIDGAKITGAESNKNISKPTKNLDSALLNLMSRTKESNMVDSEAQQTSDIDSDRKIEQDIRLNAASTLTPNNQKTVQELIDELQDYDPFVCVNAAYTLGNMGEKASAAVPALIDSLGGMAEVHTAVISALGMIGDKSAIPVLIETLQKDTAPYVRGWAAWGLGNIKDKAAVPVLIEALQKDTDPDVRGWAAWGLGNIKDKAVVPVLIEALQKDTDPYVRTHAACALGKIGDKAAVPVLIEALQKDTYPDVRTRAASALGQIGDKAAIPALTEALQKDTDPYVRTHVQKALEAIATQNQ